MPSFKDSTYIYNFPNKKEFQFLYNEIFKEECYQTNINKPKLIVDIGAHIGISALYFRKTFSNAKILCIEPNPENTKYLQDNLDKNLITNIEIINKAVTNNGQTTQLFYNKDWTSTGSMFPMGWNNTQVLEMTEIDALPFSEVLNMNPDIVKLDVEGLELSLLKQNSDLLRNVKCFLIEFHEKANRKLTIINKLLSGVGFDISITKDRLNKSLSIINAIRK